VPLATATQKLLLAHDTELIGMPLSMVVEDHELPLYLSALPGSSVAMQKLLLTHDTELIT